jgi:hypothetical protein
MFAPTVEQWEQINADLKAALEQANSAESDAKESRRELNDADDELVDARARLADYRQSDLDSHAIITEVLDEAMSKLTPLANQFAVRINRDARRDAGESADAEEKPAPFRVNAAPWPNPLARPPVAGIPVRPPIEQDAPGDPSD